jgi:predicted GIY-YIG superfamily endonuclease
LKDACLWFRKPEAIEREEAGKREKKKKKENEFSSQRITPNLEFSLSVSSWS